MTKSLCRMEILVSAFGTVVMIVLLSLVMNSPVMGEDGFTKGREIEPLPPELKTGDYVWVPEVSPAGPVVIIVSIPDQEMLVYRNGVRIGRSTVSTGAKGHSTPTGIFTILQKKVDHGPPSIKARRCRICRDSHGTGSRSTQESFQGILHRMAVCGYRRILPISSTR